MVRGTRFIVCLCAVLGLVGCSSHVPEVEIPIRECAAPPEGRASTMCFALADSIYVVSGRYAEQEYSQTMMIYAPASDQWTNNIPIPIKARANGVATCTSHAAYLGLGYAGGSIYTKENYLRDWWRYEPTGRQWTRLADFPSDSTVSAVAFANEDYVWVGFGYKGFNDKLWRYSIAEDRWEEVAHKSAWPGRLMAPVAAACDGRYYQGTGFRRSGSSDWWEFFPVDQHWERRASVPGKGRHNAACAATNKSVWVMGGWHYGDSLTDGWHYEDVLRYTPSSDSWTLCGTIPCGKTENGAACAIGNTLYFGLGESNSYVLHQKWYSLED